MKKKEKSSWVTTKFLIKELWPVIPLALMLPIIVSAMNSFENGQLTLSPFHDASECSYSPYNTYSNNTRGYTYWFGRCYVQVDHVYFTRQKCGTFGFSCYEASEEHGEMYSTTVCFKLRDGERC